MVLRRLLPLIISAWCACTGAEAPAPDPAGPGVAAKPGSSGHGDAKAGEPRPAPGGAPTAPLDAQTARRGEQAADAYLRAQALAEAKPDAESEHAIAIAEIALLEATGFLDQHQPLKAGDQYLAAAKQLAGIAPEQRTLLGVRLKKADAALTRLSRRLLDEPAYNPGPPGPARPAGDDVAH